MALREFRDSAGTEWAPPPPEWDAAAAEALEALLGNAHPIARRPVD